ncbi:MAG TPA: DUF3570 domain-containing protein [Candidatus Paceibacterota bacterium]|nr:DUF3570 domain-containing protein [Candidatus Paceibacterota bacterium]
MYNTDVKIVVTSQKSLGNHRLTALALSGILYLAGPARSRGEDRVDYRYEDYSEENGRIHIKTHGVYFDTTLAPWLSLKGNYIYDAISGATPLGPKYLPGANAVNTATIDDVRKAGFLEPSFKVGNHTLSPQIAYSLESDYESIGVALNDAIELNEKNTTLQLGVAHSFDHVLPNEGELDYHGNPLTKQKKNDSSALIGVTQLLGPATILTADVTVGYSSGYLSDPYKRVLFDDVPYYPGTDPANPNAFTVWPERRPSHKLREVLFVALSHNFEPLNGAAEVTYRLHHDSFGVTANTFSFQWNQKITKYLILSPLVRFHTQTAASFYATDFRGDPDNQGVYPLPKNYSSDYRLSAMDSLTLGVSASIRLQEHVSLELAFKRYTMWGTDGVTGSQQYPKANAVTAGLSLWF